MLCCFEESEKKVYAHCAYSQVIMLIVEALHYSSARISVQVVGPAFFGPPFSCPAFSAHPVLEPPPGQRHHHIIITIIIVIITIVFSKPTKMSLS